MRVGEGGRGMRLRICSFATSRAGSYCGHARARHIVRWSALALLVLVATAGPSAVAEAYCRRATPVWTDAHPIRVVIHPEMHNFIRHPFINPSGEPQSDFACASSAECGPDGLCASGYAVAPTSRCLGTRWTRAELERAVLWTVGRINEVPADIPFVWVDLNNTATCTVDEECSDAARPWMDCFQFDTIVIVPSECNGTDAIGANWTGLQWFDNAGGGGNRNQMIRLRWSGSPNGMAYEHVAMGAANNLPNTILHEMGHAMGLGHVANDYPGTYPVCVPLTAPGAPTPLCPPGAFGTCPVMHNDFGELPGGFNNHVFGLDDIEGLVALYGLDSDPDIGNFADCSSSAPPVVERTSPDRALMSSAAVAARPSLGVVPSISFGGRMPDAQYTSRFQIYEWSWSSMASTLVASFDTPGLRSTGPFGIATSSSHRVLSTHPMRLTSDSRRWRRQVHAVRQQIAPGEQVLATLDPRPGSRGDTAVPGVSVAYHPATDSWLHAFRRADGEVLLVAWRPALGWTRVVATRAYSYSTPSIACSPNRCVIALVEVPSPVPPVTRETRLQWVEGTFEISHDGVASFTNLSGLTTSPYNVVSDPVAAAVQSPRGDWDYYIATSHPEQSGGLWGSRVLMYRRSELSTGPDALTPVTPILPHAAGRMVHPTAGSTRVCAEQLTARAP